VLNLYPVVLADWKIFAGFCKFKSMSPKLGHVPFDLVFCMLSKLLIVIGAHSKFEVSSFCRCRDIGVRILKTWASSAILDSTLSGFWQFQSSLEPRSTILWNLNAICPHAAELERCNRFSNYPTLGAILSKCFSELGALDVCHFPQIRAHTSALYANVLGLWFSALFLNHCARNACRAKNRRKISWRGL